MSRGHSHGTVLGASLWVQGGMSGGGKRCQREKSTRKEGKEVCSVCSSSQKERMNQKAVTLGAQERAPSLSVSLRAAQFLEARERAGSQVPRPNANRKMGTRLPFKRKTSTQKQDASSKDFEDPDLPTNLQLCSQQANTGKLLELGLSRGGRAQTQNKRVAPAHAW